MFLALKTAVNDSTTRGVFYVKDFLGMFLKKPAIRDLAISTFSIYGVYVVSSFIHGEPWHIFNSFAQYLILVPTFVNILMVYAFCNLHDTSWGTKGSLNALEAAPVLLSNEQSGIQLATIHLPTSQRDIDETYEMFVRDIKAIHKVQAKNSGRSQEDYFRSFRTRLLLFWILSNTLLIAVFTSDEFAVYMNINSTEDPSFNLFLTIIFWSVAVMSWIRFIGSMCYKLERMSSNRQSEDIKHVYKI